MASLLERHHPDLAMLNPLNPTERDALMDGFLRIQTQYDRAQHQVTNDPRTLGHQYSERLIRVRDRLDATLNEIHQLLHTPHDGESTFEYCRSRDCRNTALPAMEGAGYCSRCFEAAKTGTKLEYDTTNTPARPVIGIYGRHRPANEGGT